MMIVTLEEALARSASFRLGGDAEMAIRPSAEPGRCRWIFVRA
jgi:hypothetical protein